MTQYVRVRCRNNHHDVYPVGTFSESLEFCYVCANPMHVYERFDFDEFDGAIEVLEQVEDTKIS